ncbi:MAG TPA: Rrf2 family transcriptional regulator [candidate division Zixibacteria bacterium]|nr:Rrf2 family transcriptional regulator [candidate division Zixibacteria bacterium]
MRITKQEEYGLRCVLQLAQNGTSSKTTVEIAAKEGLSMDNVTKLLILLRRHKIVESVRGVKGGYRLARNPEKITVGQVMRALGWSVLDESLCQHYPGKLDACVHLQGCGIRPIWRKAAQMMYKLFDSTSLADLLKQEEVIIQDLEQK